MLKISMAEAELKLALKDAEIHKLKAALLARAATNSKVDNRRFKQFFCHRFPCLLILLNSSSSDYQTALKESVGFPFFITHGKYQLARGKIFNCK